MKWCVIVQGPADTHPDKNAASIVAQIGKRINSKVSYENINDAYRYAAEWTGSGKLWIYTVAECEK